MLYQDGMKTEAKALSQFANQLVSKQPVTQAQRQFDKATTRQKSTGLDMEL